MMISICPKCYEKGKIVEGKFLNSVGFHWLVYWCKDCKDSYKEQ
jgi:hypothetical protein